MPRPAPPSPSLPAERRTSVGGGARRRALALAPATLSNLGCGFDVLGLALEAPGDEVVASVASGRGVVAVGVTGGKAGVPGDPARNSAALAAQAVIDRSGLDAGVEILLRKGIPFASGLGGSAASAVAGALATDELLGSRLDGGTLLECARRGELAGSGSEAADNVAASLTGGLVLAVPGRPPVVVRLPVPAGLAVAVARPHIEVETRVARELLGPEITLAAGVSQWGNTAGLVAGLFREDWELIARCLRDEVAEPVRAGLVPGFWEARAAALQAGSLGAGLSGTGPAVFALCRGRNVAGCAADAMQKAFGESSGLGCDAFVSAAGAPGARVVPASARAPAGYGAQTPPPASSPESVVVLPHDEVAAPPDPEVRSEPSRQSCLRSFGRVGQRCR